MATISKKRKFVADGVFRAELNEFLTRELAEDGYSGVEVRTAPTKIGKHTSELQSHHDLVCRLLLEKKKKIKKI